MYDLIQRVCEKAEVDTEVAERTIDIVLTEVKQKLPDDMAKILVDVMAGETSYQQDYRDTANSATPETHSVSTEEQSDSSTSAWGILKSVVKPGSLREKLSGMGRKKS